MRPDAPNPTYSVLMKPEQKATPVIIFGTTALKWIKALVEVHQQEVGFYAAVDHREDGSYFVRDVFYPKHSEMQWATCEISPEGESDMMNWLLDKGREADIQKIRFWGHSHHTMGTSPSSQDEKQSIERMNSTQAFLIRAICNKAGEMSVSFYDYEKSLRFDHLKWTSENDNQRTDDQILQDVVGIVNSEKASSEKVSLIKNLFDEDIEMEKITEKVRALKLINEPATKGYTTSVNGTWHERQTQSSMFPNDFRGSKKNRTEKNSSGPKGRSGFEDLVTEDPMGVEELEIVMSQWERNS